MTTERVRCEIKSDNIYLDNIKQEAAVCKLLH